MEKIDGRKNKVRIITPSNLEKLNLYKKYKNLTKVAEELGVSRQCVEQIVYKAIILGDKEIEEIKNSVGDHSKEFCKVCGRPFKVVKVIIKGLCPACYVYRNKKSLRGRNLFRVPNCANCSTPFRSEGKIIQSRYPVDLCRKCYVKSEKYKEYQKKYKDKRK